MAYSSSSAVVRGPRHDRPLALGHRAAERVGVVDGVALLAALLWRWWQHDVRELEADVADRQAADYARVSQRLRLRRDRREVLFELLAGHAAARRCAARSLRHSRQCLSLRQR
jgi:alpha-L-fucosidase